MIERLSSRVKASFGDTAPVSVRGIRKHGSETACESLEKGLLTRRRLRHELARSLLTTIDDSVVQAFLSVAHTVFEAHRPDDDLLSVFEFIDMYSDLNNWAERVASSESAGGKALHRILQRDSDPHHSQFLPRRPLSRPLLARRMPPHAHTHQHRTSVALPPRSGISWIPRLSPATNFTRCL